VMPDMGIGQEGAAVANDGLHATAFRTWIDGHTFTDQAVGADCKRRGFPPELEILRLMPDGGKRKDARARPDRRTPCHHHMTDQFAAIAENSIAADNAVRT